MYTLFYPLYYLWEIYFTPLGKYISSPLGNTFHPPALYNNRQKTDFLQFHLDKLVIKPPNNPRLSQTRLVFCHKKVCAMMR